MTNFPALLRQPFNIVIFFISRDEMINVVDSRPEQATRLREKLVSLIYANPSVTAGILFPDALTDPVREWR